MLLLCIGLGLFLSVHSARMLAEQWRTQFIARKGEKFYKSIYTIASLASFALLVYGYGQTRHSAIYLWHPPAIFTLLAAPVMLVSFIFLAASNIPRNHIKQFVGHPMSAGVVLWAIAHLLVNGRIGDVVLFGAFLVWATLNFFSSRKRDKRGSEVGAITSTITNDAICVIAGSLAWGVFVFWAHRQLMGVSPLVL